MKALSLRQPWLWLILHAGKDVENRVWFRRVQGPVLLHAAKGCDAVEYVEALDWAYEAELVSREVLSKCPPPDAIERGGICGVATFTGKVLQPVRPGFVSPLITVQSSYGWHIPNQYGYQIGDARPLPFVPWRGALGFFEVEEEPFFHMQSAVADPYLDLLEVG